MCGILYKSNFNSKTDYIKFIKAHELLRHRGPDGYGYYFIDKHSLGRNKMYQYDNDVKQPIVKNNKMFMMDGYLTNYYELNDKSDNRADSILIFKLLDKYHLDTLNMINGAYSFIYIKEDKIYAVRDRFGVKPLYYTQVENDIIIASEIKAIINYTDEKIIDKEGLCELLGMGPSHSIGKTVYKNVFEVPPGCYLEFDGTQIKVIEYYDVKSKDCPLTYSEAMKQVKKEVIKSITSVIPEDKNVSSFLSGGLDSTIVSTILSNHIGKVDTYLIDYEENDNEFVPNTYEISQDKEYARLVSKNINSNHHEIIIPNNIVFEYLKKGVEARDFPSMTDIDSSLLYLVEHIDSRVCLTGECADEIFGGYRWFYEETQYVNGFPWIKSLDFKEDLLNDKYKLNLKDYVLNEYNNAIKKVNSSKRTKMAISHQQMCYINLKYCMTNLLDRCDRMCMSSSIDSRAPFCDYKLIELLYNLPLSYKYRLKTEKKLLRDCFKKEVIKEVGERKKSPYPKSRSQQYEIVVKNELLKIIDGDSILNELFNKDKLTNFINEDKEMVEPWYGQLMRKTSLLAYLYQIDYWFKKYNIRIDLVE